MKVIVARQFEKDTEKELNKTATIKAGYLNRRIATIILAH